MRVCSWHVVNEGRGAEGCRWLGGLQQWAPSWTSGSPERMAACLGAESST